MKKQIYLNIFDVEDTYSDFLFALPSFIEGCSRVLDLGDTINNYNESDSNEEADFKAIMSDWLTIGNDIKRSIEIVYDENQEVNRDDSR
jgi:hypothetical protein